MKNENNDIDEELRIVEQKIKIFNEHVKGFQKNMEQAHVSYFLYHFELSFFLAYISDLYLFKEVKEKTILKSTVYHNSFDFSRKHL